MMSNLPRFGSRNCPILEQTADGHSCGRCCYYLPDGKTCPTHGDVSDEVERYRTEGYLTLENTMRKRKGLKLLGKKRIVPMCDEKRFDTAMVRAKLHDIQYAASMYGAPVGGIADIAHAALDELDRRSLHVEKQHAVIEMAAEKNERLADRVIELEAELARRDAEAEKRQATDYNAFLEWLRSQADKNGIPVCDSTSALEGWQACGRRAEATKRKLREQLVHGDYWQERSKLFHELGGCPVCFATDEAGHKPDCPWGKDEAELARLRAVIRELRGEALASGWVYPSWWNDACTGERRGVWVYSYNAETKRMCSGVTGSAAKEETP